MYRIGIMLLVVSAIMGCSSEPEMVWVSGWKNANPLNVPRAGAAAVVHNGYIYVIAGVDGRNFLRSTEYAKINEDGSLGPWQVGTQLNEERGFTEAIVWNGMIYVVGGGNGPNGQHLLRSVERAKINPNGSIGQWIKEEHQTVLPRRCTKVSLIGNTIYSFGGFGGTLLDSVEYSVIQDDGSVGEWKMASETMTMPRYVNSVKAVDGVAYVIGGHDQMKGVGIADVEWAKPDESGDMRHWSLTSPLKTGRYGLASAAYHGTIYVLGGLTGLEYLRSVEVAKVQKEGGMAEWRETTAMTVPRATFSVVKNEKWVYVIGGTNRDGYLQSAEYTSINSEGDLGFFGTQQDQKEYQQSLERAKSSGPALANSGVVKQVLQTQMYSYVQVETSDGVVWLAGPKVDLPINSRIRFSKGVYMSKFYSKELQRSFPAVTFVSRIERE